MRTTKPWLWPKSIAFTQSFLPKKIVNHPGYTINNFINNKRYFLRLKRFRKVFTRYDELDSIFISTISLAFILDLIFYMNIVQMIPNSYT